MVNLTLIREQLARIPVLTDAQTRRLVGQLRRAQREAEAAALAAGGRTSGAGDHRARCGRAPGRSPLMATWLKGPGYRIRLSKVDAVVPTDTAHPEDGSTIVANGTLLQVSEGAEEVCRRLEEAAVERVRAKVGFTQ